MLNLAYPIDDTVNINGTEYVVDMSFDNILRLFDLIEDKTIRDDFKVNTGLLMLINDKLEDYELQERTEIFIELVKSVIDSDAKESQPVDIDGNPMPVMPSDDKKAYDLAQDAEYIYASFMHTYKIDLFEQQGVLHWKKFKGLLNGLSEDTIFSRIVGIRTAELPSGKGTAKERERMQKLKRQYALKENDTEP